MLASSRCNTLLVGSITNPVANNAVRAQVQYNKGVPRRLNRSGGIVHSIMAFAKVGATYVVQPEAGKAVIITISFDLLVIDVVVTKTAKKEVRERIAPVAKRISSGETEPQR